MTDVTYLSIQLSNARKHIKKAHQVAETSTEPMEHTAEAIQSLGIQHYGRGGEDMPERIITAQVRAMVELTFAYAEQAHEASGGGLGFFDDSQRDEFDEHLDNAHDAAMKALREVEGDE